jgi:type II secretory pathway pseudopilin PulG
MPARSRSAFTLFQLLVVIALLVLGFTLSLPALARALAEAKKAEQLNNLKQLCLALHSHAAANRFALPASVDDNNFSAASRLLPYLENGEVYKKINYTKPITDDANAEARKTEVAVFLSPRDPVKRVRDDSGATNYLFNDLLFAREPKYNISNIPDGSSTTIAIGETLKGDGSDKAEDVRRQYVLLKKDALKGVTPDTGASYWKENDKIAGDRCASWMDGRFLQGTFNGKLKPNDERPDANCGGEGGVSTLRSLNDQIAVGLADGSTRFIDAKKISFTTWTYAIDPADGNVLGPDW